MEQVMTNQMAKQDNTKKIILVVEDDTNVQKIYKSLLSKEGYEVSITDTVDKAYDLLSKTKVDLILLDIMLPGGKNGYDFLEIVQKDELLRKIPVIVLSNLDQDKNVSTNMGVISWMVKANVSSQDVVTIVNQVLNDRSTKA
jgi:DNA-binding response OmpR family regulator